MPPDEFYCWQALEKTGIYMIPGQVFEMKGSGNNFQWTFTTGKIWINKGDQLQAGILMILKTCLLYHLRPCVTRFSQACLIYLDWLDWMHI